MLDPFMGSGSTAVAAVRTERHFAGFDTDAEYKKITDTRVSAERTRLAEEQARGDVPRRVVVPALKESTEECGDDLQARAVRDGLKASDVARLALEACGFTDIRADVAHPAAGVVVTFEARDATGRKWCFDLSGAFTTTRPGLRRTDTLWIALGRAAALHAAHPETPIVLLSTNTPMSGSAGDRALKAVALSAWMEATGSVVDVYADEVVWTGADFDEERVALEPKVARILPDPLTWIWVKANRLISPRVGFIRVFV